MGESTGTIRKAVIDGITFDAMADANINFKRSKYEKEGIATSGKTLVKMTRRVQNIESLDLGCTPAEMELIAGISEKLVAVPMAVTLADGSTYRGTGHVHFDGYESESGKISVTLIPTGEWRPFLA